MVVGSLARTARRGVVFPVLVFVVWRLAHLVLAAVFGATGFAPALQWDGGFYDRIFRHGYHLAEGEGTHVTAFFPGLAWLTHGVDVLAPSGRSAEVVTANLVACASFVAVWGAAQAWRSDRIARRAVVLLALFPASIFVWSYYSEAAFIALGAGAVWADRRKKHWLAALLLAGVATTRTIGMTVGAVLVIARWVRGRRVDWVVVAYVGATAVGVLSVMGTLWADMGEPFSWVSAQKYWGRELSIPWTWIGDGVAAMVDRSHPQRILDFFSVGAVIVTVVYSWKRRPDPWPLEARLLPIAFLIVPLCTPTPQSSLNRFVLASWPSFAVGAEMLDRVPRWARASLYLIAALGSVVFAGSGRTGSSWASCSALPRVRVEPAGSPRRRTLPRNGEEGA